MPSLALFTNELRLHLIEMRQYWFETVTGLIFMCAVFIGLFYGIKSFVVDANSGSSLDGLLFGFLLWSFASQAYQSVTRSIIEDTQKGYIEQLFLSPRGFTGVMLSKVLVELLSGILFVTLLAYVTMWLTGNWLDLNLPALYACLLLAAPSLVGVGFLISGLALVFKRVETIGAMLSLALMGLVALDALPLNGFTLLPFAAGASLAREWVLQGLPLNGQHVILVAGNSVLYFALGLFAFKRLEALAKRRNLIGQY